MGLGLRCCGFRVTQAQHQSAEENDGIELLRYDLAPWDVASELCGKAEWVVANQL